MLSLSSGLHCMEQDRKYYMIMNLIRTRDDQEYFDKLHIRRLKLSTLTGTIFGNDALPRVLRFLTRCSP